jgi:RNA:NAD 2'-phosphotransferase (TPT1/KptA family)
VVAGNAKQRFAISADGLRIRASQGHSLTAEVPSRYIRPMGR